MTTLTPIVETLIIDANADEVWLYIATSEGLNKWFMPNDFKAQEGYKFTIQSPFGASPCIVEKVITNQLIQFKWDEENWRVTIELKILNDQSAVTITHTGWGESADIISKAQLPAGVVHEKMVGGWQNIVQNKLAKFF